MLLHFTPVNVSELLTVWMTKNETLTHGLWPHSLNVEKSMSVTAQNGWRVYSRQKKKIFSIFYSLIHGLCWSAHNIWLKFGAFAIKTFSFSLKWWIGNFFRICFWCLSDHAFEFVSTASEKWFKFAHLQLTTPELRTLRAYVPWVLYFLSLPLSWFRCRFEAGACADRSVQLHN